MPDTITFPFVDREDSEQPESAFNLKNKEISGAKIL